MAKFTATLQKVSPKIPQEEQEQLALLLSRCGTMRTATRNFAYTFRHWRDKEMVPRCNRVPFRDKGAYENYKTEFQEFYLREEKALREAAVSYAEELLPVVKGEKGKVLDEAYKQMLIDGLSALTKSGLLRLKGDLETMRNRLSTRHGFADFCEAVLALGALASVVAAVSSNAL